MNTRTHFITSDDGSVYERWTDGSTTKIQDGPAITLIHDGYRTYALPKEPTPCGACGAMSGVFINRCGATACCRCDVEDRLLHQTWAGHAAREREV